VEVGDWAEVGAVRGGTVAPPGRPGVYGFRDAAGGLLYIGTSRCLARRVRSYFAPRHHAASKAGRIARLAVRVEWWTCGSVLEALVLEARTIARERPHFNRRLKDAGRHAYVRFDPTDPFPRLEMSRQLEDGPWRYLGPFPGGRPLAVALERLADALGLRTCPGRLRPEASGRACIRLDLGQCLGPCVAGATAGVYGRQLARALAALGGTHPEVSHAVGARGGPGPVPLPGPVAGALRALHAARRAQRVVAVVPAADGPGHRLLAVAGGRLRLAVGVPDAAALRAAFTQAVRALAPGVDPLLARAALDEVRVVTAWLATPAGRAAAIDLEQVGPAGAWARLAARVGPGPLFAVRPAVRSAPA
jgi:DNA polymerase-3 subunit epsilon